MAQDQAGFQNYLSIIRAKAMASGVRPATLDNALPSLTLNPRVIELDQSQPGGSFDSPIPPFETYRPTTFDNALIFLGRVAYHANHTTLRATNQAPGAPEARKGAI